MTSMRRWSTGLRLMVVAIGLLVAGCSTTSSMVGGTAADGGDLGVRERCGRAGGECFEAGQRLIDPILANLGSPYTGPGIDEALGALVAVEAPNDDEPATLVVSYQFDPSRGWRAADAGGEVRGRTTAVSVDLAPLLRGEQAYAVVEAEVGVGRFLVLNELAEQLFATFYVR